MFLVFKRREEIQCVKHVLDTKHVNGKNQEPRGEREGTSAFRRDFSQEKSVGQGKLESARDTWLSVSVTDPRASQSRGTAVSESAA